MTEKALAAGADAFAHGTRRDANPYDAGEEDWMCWRDGWEQAKAAADRTQPALDTAATGPAGG